MLAWRIVKERHAAAALEGEGARLHGGRWNSPGVPVVYASESRALAILEVLAGAGAAAPLDAYVLIGLGFDPGLVSVLGEDALPRDWRRSPPPSSTQRAGDDWVRSGRSAVLRVPSVLVPREFNYLFNPWHPAFASVRIAGPEPLTFDERLL